MNRDNEPRRLVSGELMNRSITTLVNDSYSV